MPAIIKPSATVIYIFGGSGDLNFRKLTPALYNLFLDGYMPEKFFVVGVGRSPYTNESFATHLKTGIDEFSRRKGEQNGHWEEFSQKLAYQSVDVGKESD